MIKQLTIIGVGLIGGSLARALRAKDQVGSIIGCNRDEANLKQAVSLGIIDEYNLDVAAAVKEADMVLLAVPVGAMASVLQQMKGHLSKNVVVTDVGSTKGSVVEAAREVFSTVPDWFVPGHPIAGIEKSGAEVSFADLFKGRRVILTPLPHTRVDAIAKVRAMWQTTGAIVEEVDVEHHDRVLAATSHLPHLLAYSLVDTLAKMDDSEDVFRFAAGGFLDFTRIASSDPRMWHDICVNNREAILAVLERFNNDLTRLGEAIENNESDYLMDMFSHAKESRDQFCK